MGKNCLSGRGCTSSRVLTFELQCGNNLLHISSNNRVAARFEFELANLESYFALKEHTKEDAREVEGSTLTIELCFSTGDVVTVV